MSHVTRIVPMSSITLDSLEDYDKIITPQHNCIYYVNGGEFVFLNGQDVTSDYATPDNVVNRIMGRPDVPIQEEQALTPVESISIDSESVEDIVEDDDIFLAVNVSPNTAYTDRIYATCSDTSKVTVYGPIEPLTYSPVLGSAYTTVHYVLHGLEPTETPVTVTVKDQRSGKSSSAQFNVLSKKITGIELRQVDVEEGSSLNLYYYITITPDYADTSGLTWTSSNEDAVSMNSGTITGVSASDELATIKVVDANTGISSEMKCECYVPITEVTFSLANGYDFPNGRRPYAVLEEGDSSTVFYTVNPSNASVTKLTVQPSAESQGHVTYENEILSLGEVGDKTKGNLYYVDAIDERSSIKPTIDSNTEISHNRLYISAWPVLDAITFEKTKVDIYGINKVINNYSDSCSWIPNQIYYRKTYPEDYRYPYPYPEVTWDDNLIDVTDFHTIYEDGGDFIITPKASATEDVTTKISVATNRMSGSFDVVLHPPKDITQILFYDSAAITSLNVAKNISSKTIEVIIQPPWSGNGREYVTAVSSDATLVSVVSLTFDDDYSEGQMYNLILASHDIAGNATITVTAKNMSAGLAVTVTA